MELPVALLGSVTDHGGRIISGQQHHCVDDVPIACKGDLHECPIPGHGTTPIVEGASNQCIDDRYMAYVGCRTGCGARITQGTPHFTIWVDQPALSSTSVDFLRATGQGGFDEHFAFTDRATGQPAEGVHYELYVGERRQQGVSGEDGHTDHALTDTPSEVQLTGAVQQRIGVRK